MDMYILVDGEPVRTSDIHVWGRFIQNHENKIVAKTKVTEDVSVSTVFLGMDHSWDGPPPVLWETMIFGGEHDLWQDRYTSAAAAKLGHEYAVRIAKGEAKVG